MGWYRAHKPQKSGREEAIKASEWRACKDKTCAQKFMSKAVSPTPVLQSVQLLPPN